MKRALQFGYGATQLRFWRQLVRQALRQQATPFYLFSVEPLRAALGELETLQRGVDVPVRHWLSFKTQPIKPLVRWWRKQGGSVEVVSEFEYRAALAEGFAPERILLNGPAKHTWLPRHAVAGLNVHFDSLTEAKALASLARKLRWRVGVRLHTREEHDPENPTLPTQFGMQADEAVRAIQFLQRARVKLESVHFHLRTNVAQPAIYERALRDVATVCARAGFAPRYVDCGGGLPPPNVLSPDGKRYDAQFELAALVQVYRRALKWFPAARELWLENGRFLSARSGVLVLQVREVKERRGIRQLICDAGRTTHALISNWEAHELLCLPPRRGPRRLTAVCGPTCMAFDQLARRPLPAGIRAGDHLIWLDAGAYHIPWETRFSHGWAAAWWHEGGRLKLARPAESFEKWWGQWA